MLLGNPAYSYCVYDMMYSCNLDLPPPLKSAAVSIPHLMRSYPCVIMRSRRGRLGTTSVPEWESNRNGDMHAILAI